jgi:hypothetical protein
MCKDNIVRVVPIHEGMKIFMTSEESFLEADRQLNEYGFTTRCNAEQWSIYIVSAPYERDDGLIVRIL